MGIVRPVARRIAALGAVMGALIVGGICGGGGQALAVTSAVPAAPLAGSTSAALSQVNAGEWTTTVYLDTAALCAGKNPAGNKFSLVTGKPNSVTGAAAPTYPDGPLACGAAAAAPVTQVKLTFTPSLSAVPQTATLTVTPPQALLLAGDPPVQIPLTVRRAVSPWQYVGIPGICGAALAVLLVLFLMAIGMPGRDLGQAVAPANKETAKRETLPEQHGPEQNGPEQNGSGQYGQVPERGQLDFNARLLLFLMTKRHDIAKDTGDPAPTGEVVAASLWVMLLASCLTVFAIGAEIGFVGLVLGFDLIVASPSIRWIGPAVTGLAAVLFLGFGAHSILTLIGQPSGAPKKTAAKSSFMI